MKASLLSAAPCQWRRAAQLSLTTLFILLAEVTLAGPPPPISYYLPLVDFARYASVIAETDLVTARRLLIDSTFSWSEADLTFIRGSRADTTLPHDGWMWYRVQPYDSVPPPPMGERVWLLLIPQQAVPYGVYHITNSLQILSAAEAPHYRERLMELLALERQGDTAALWHWVMRGLANPSETIHTDALTTISLAVDTEQEKGSPYGRNPYQTPSKSLNIRYFPADQLDLLRQIVADSVAAHPHEALPYSTQTLLKFCQLVGVKGLPELYLNHAAQLMQWLDNARITGIPVEYPEYTFSADISDLTLACAAIAHCHDVTRYELMRAARLILFAERWTAEYPALFGPNFYTPYDYIELAIFLQEVTGQKVSGQQQLKRQLNHLYDLPYESDKRVALERVFATIRSITTETGTLVGMCSDTEISTLTGARNWWGCHQAEAKLETFMLSNASPLDSVGQAIAIAPNPCRGRCTVEWKAASEATRVTLMLMDATGRQVWSQKHELVRYAPVQQAIIELPTALAAGSYSLQIAYPDRQLQIRVMIE